MLPGDGFPLIDNIAVDVLGVNVPFGAPGSDESNLYFCIREQLDPLMFPPFDVAYAASSLNVPPNNWEVIYLS